MTILKNSTTTITAFVQNLFDSIIGPKSWNNWTANRFNYTVRWFGPYEVNFNYYPSWIGNDRIIVMPIESALRLDIF